jgi:hypothetical protein
MRPRVILQFPPNANDMLLSGGVLAAENLENRPQVIDAPVGTGHVVIFAIRPFWRWQTQGTFILGFNALMHWNDLNAVATGDDRSRPVTTGSSEFVWSQVFRPRGFLIDGSSDRGFSDRPGSSDPGDLMSPGSCPDPGVSLCQPSLRRDCVLLSL